MGNKAKEVVEEGATRLPPKKMWDNQKLLMEWALKNKYPSYDKAKSWVKGFMMSGSKKK